MENNTLESKIAHDICNEFANKVQGLVIDMLAKEITTYKTETMKQYVMANGSSKYMEILDKIIEIEHTIQDLQK